MSAAFAFLHHLAAFALVAGMAIELVLIRQPLDAALARRLALADAVVGVSAGVVLVVGLLRVFYLEKGAAFYMNNAAARKRRTRPAWPRSGASCTSS